MNRVKSPMKGTIQGGTERAVIRRLGREIHTDPRHSGISTQQSDNFHEVPFYDQDGRSQILLTLRPSSSERLDKLGERQDKLYYLPGIPITKTDSETSNEDEDTPCFTPGLPRSSLRAITGLPRKRSP